MRRADLRKEGCKLCVRERRRRMTYSFHLQPSERFAFVFRAGLKGRNTLYARGEKKGGCRYQANIGSQKVKGS